MSEATPNLLQRVQETYALAKLVGDAPIFIKSLVQLPCVARGDANVLITGETGTGKELVARAIHYGGNRASYPFTPVNCGSLPDTLLENELFGHEKGAFTSAEMRRPGIIAQAEQGTLFLDEVEALSQRAQIVLLRLLQDKTFRPLGSTREQKADIRIIAATNAPLDQLVVSGAFRSDLYYRLCVFSIDLPPLRDRKEDIPRLAAHFLRKHVRGDGAIRRLTAQASSALMGYHWPGNIRELESAMIRGIQGAETELIAVKDLDLPYLEQNEPSQRPSQGQESFKQLKTRAVHTFEKNYLTLMMREHHGNVSHAARTAGKDRREFGKLLKKYQLEPKSFIAPTDEAYAVGDNARRKG